MGDAVVRDSDHARSILQLLLAALCWSLAGVLFKFVDWPPLAAAGGRGLIAALFLAAVCGRALRFTWSPVQLGAAVAYAGCTVLFAAANKLTTAANAILLQYTAPIYVAVLGAWCLHERPHRRDWVALTLALGGMTLFLFEGLRLGDLPGILVAIGSGICFGAMIVLLRLQKAASPLESIVLGNVLGFLVGLPAITSAPLPSATTLGALLLLGTVQLGISYVLYARALRHVTAMETVLLPVLEPILNPLWVMLAVGERPTALALLGGGIVLGAVTWRAREALRRPSAA